MAAATILLIVLLLQPIASFHHNLRHQHCSDTKISLNNKLTIDTRSSLIESNRHLSTVYDDNWNVHVESRKKQHPLPFFLLLSASCYWCCFGFPQFANAALPDTQHTTIVHEKQSCTTISSTMSSSAILSADTYASQGSGGLPFLSPFQKSGTVPQPTDSKYDDRDARNRAYDEAFDQDKRDRDAYYAKMALQAREKKMAELRQRRAELGLEGLDAAPRFGDEKVYDMASLKKYLSEKDPSTMTSAELKELQQLQNR